MPTVLVRVDLDALRNDVVGPGQICEIPGVGAISLRTAREIMGAGFTDLVITNGCDVATVVGIGRHVPQTLFDALMERDPRCIVPGCRQAAHLEIDHCFVDFAKGGPGHWQFVPPKGVTADGREDGPEIGQEDTPEDEPGSSPAAGLPSRLSTRPATRRYSPQSEAKPFHHRE